MSHLSLQKAHLIDGPWMTCSRNAPSQTPSVRCVHVSSQRPLKPQSVISS